MTMIKCSECGKEISAKAKKCPHCGASNKISKSRKQNKYIKIIITILIILCITIIALFVGYYNSDEIGKDRNGNIVKAQDLIGTWKLLNENIENVDKKMTIKEVIKYDSCAGVSCPERYYKVDNRLYIVNSYYNNYNLEFLCLILEDKNTLRQVSCDVLKGYPDVIGREISESMTDYAITYKKVTN